MQQQKLQQQQEKRQDALMLLEQAREARAKGEEQRANALFQAAERQHQNTKQIHAAIFANPDEPDFDAGIKTAVALGEDPADVVALREKLNPPPAFHPAGSQGVNPKTGLPIPGATIPEKVEPGSLGEYVRNQRADLAKTGEAETPAHLLKWTKDYHTASRPESQTEWAAWQQSYPGTLGKKDWASLTPEEQTKGVTAFSTAKQTPESAETAELRQSLLRLQIGQQPTKEDAALIAKQLVDKKLAPSQVQLFGGFGAAGAAFKRMVGTEALRLNPDFDWEESESTYQLSKSSGFQNTVRYMDSVTESIPRLRQNATKLANGKFKTWTALLNAGKQEFNDTDLKAFKTDALLVGDEVAKLLQGGGTGGATSDAKLKQATELISATDSVPAMARGLDEIEYLIGNRRKSLVRGTYYERQPAGGGPTAPKVLPKVGDEITVKGVKVRVTKINPDGTMNVVGVK